MKEPLVLAIDTSFDETAVAVVKGLTVLSNLRPTQSLKHQEFGGVVPSLAKFEHQKIIDQVIELALKRSKIQIENVDAIAVTYGPGLAITLEVGINKAKELAKKFNKPLVIVNHMEGHLLSSIAQKYTKNQSTKSQSDSLSLDLIKKRYFPAIGFLISGGHTELILINDFLDYKKVGQTLDDSAGEAYDKCGRILGFGYPAGPSISDFAKRQRGNFKFRKFKENRSFKIEGTNIKTKKIYQLPIPMYFSNDLNFSFSGLKTAFKDFAEDVIKKSVNNKETILDLCVMIEASIVNHLNDKLEKALTIHKPKSVLLGGGVISSAKVRSVLRSTSKEYKANLYFPYSKALFTDNAAMIGIVANIKLIKSSNFQDAKKLKTYGIFKSNFNTIDRKPNLSL